MYYSHGLCLFSSSLFSNDNDEKHLWDTLHLLSTPVLVIPKDYCWVLSQWLINTANLHKKLWFGFRAVVVDGITSDGKRKNDLQGHCWKLQRILLPVPLLNQKITRVKINFIYFGWRLEEALAENSSARVSSH